MKQFDESIKVEEARIARKKAEAFACRRYSEKFASNIKLHDHVREKHNKKLTASSPTIAIVTPPVLFLLAPSATITTVTLFASPSTSASTSKKSIFWAEIVSRPKLSAMLSRLFRSTALSTPSATFSHSSHLQPILHQNSANNITRRLFTTSYLTMQDLYTRFHGKPKPTSLIIIRIRLPSASSSNLRQARITVYFKLFASNSPGLTAQLVSNRKYADLNTSGKSPEIDNLALFSKVLASHFTRYHICRRCTQHFTSGNMLHRHLPHCSPCTQR